MPVRTSRRRRFAGNRVASIRFDQERGCPSKFGIRHLGSVACPGAQGSRESFRRSPRQANSPAVMGAPQWHVTGSWAQVATYFRTGSTQPWLSLRMRPVTAVANPSWLVTVLASALTLAPGSRARADRDIVVGTPVVGEPEQFRVEAENGRVALARPRHPHVRVMRFPFFRLMRTVSSWPNLRRGRLMHSAFIGGTVESGGAYR